VAEIHYVGTGYVAPAYYQTGISIDWLAKVIHVPKMFLDLVSGVAYELDTNKFRLALRDLEDDEAGMPFSPTHNHNTTVTLAGVQYARVLEILAPYTITFEDGQYSVNLIGSNNNIGDRANINQVSVRVNNSAGLQNVSTPTNVVTGTALTAEQTAAAVWSNAIENSLTAEQILRILAAALAGTSEKTGSTIVFKGLDGTTDRIIGSFDAENNRTGAVLDGN
jgi:hypothetical protein